MAEQERQGLGYLQQAPARTNNFEKLATGSANFAEQASDGLYNGVTETIPDAIKSIPSQLSSTVLGGIDSIRDFTNTPNGMRAPKTGGANTADDLGRGIDSIIKGASRIGDDIAYSTNAAGQFIGGKAHDAFGQQNGSQPIELPAGKIGTDLGRKLLKMKPFDVSKQPSPIVPPEQVQASGTGGVSQPVSQNSELGLSNIINLLANNQPQGFQPQQFTPNRTNNQPERSILNQETGINANSMAGGLFGGAAGMNTALAALLPLLEQRNLNRRADTENQKAIENERAYNNDARDQYNKDNAYNLGLAGMLGDLSNKKDIIENRRIQLNGTNGSNFQPVKMIDENGLEYMSSFNKQTGKAKKVESSLMEQYNEGLVRYKDNPEKLKQINAIAIQRGLIGAGNE